MAELKFGMYASWVPITPSGTTQVTCRAIYVGGAGHVDVQSQEGGVFATAVVFSAVPAGTILPIELNQGLVATSSTATLMIALN